MSGPTTAPDQPRAEFPADWYPDPTGRFELRYYNGRAWTSDVSTDGQRHVDAFGTAPTPVTAASPGHGQPGFSQPGYGQPGFGAPRRRNGFAVTAMVLGICGAGIAWLPYIFFLGAVACILAIIFGVIAIRRAASTGTGRGFAITGIVTGIVGLLLAIVGWLFTQAFVDAFDAYYEPAPNSVELTVCAPDGDGAARIEGTITHLDVPGAADTDDEAADFNIAISIVRAGTDNLQRTVTVDVQDVAVGESASFATTANVAVDAFECEVADVFGPLPFGVQP